MSNDLAKRQHRYTEPLRCMDAALLAVQERRKAVQVKVAGMLRVERLKARMPLRRMARRMGYSAPFVSDVEQGERTLTVAFICRYLAELEQNGNDKL